MPDHLLRVFLLFLLTSASAFGQSDRIAGTIDSSARVILKGNSNPRARAEFDRGAVDRSLRMSGVTLNFRLAQAQQTALDQLLAEQQDPKSRTYHRWLQPAEFADRFGLSASDLAKVAAWAESQELHVDYRSNTRTFLRCSGTAAQVEKAFQTAIHRFDVNGETHYANASDPTVPAALAPLVAVVSGLDDFYPQAPRHTKQALPQNNGGANGTTHYVIPADLWTIYDAMPLVNAGINGTGQKLVVVGQSNTTLSDVQAFRSQFGLPNSSPQIIAVPGSSPNMLSGQQEEISLDLEIAGGIAPNASLIYVYAGNALAAVQYAIDQNYAPVISYSYALCEAQITAQGVTGAVLERLAQMGNAMGITWVASSGDQGAAACDNAPGTSGASNGLAVNIPASIPEVTAVGGTTFNDVGGGYWSATNSVSGASAKSYIPEATWNDFTITHLLTASGGGASALYAKPAWQTGPGVPNDGARDVPDVSFAASPNHDGYLMVQEGVSTIVGGTSASTPVFAGMLTLLNQYLVAAGLQKTAGLGNVNPTLYRIARSSGNVMHDVTSGDNVVACALNTPNCTGGEIGWAAGTGYDLATGLGSVDLTNLAKQWVTGPGAALTLAAVPGVMNDNTSQPNCPFEELLVVQENNGYPVELTRLTTSAGKDYSASILNLFGSLRLPANGALLAPVCWTGITPSYTEIVELDGVDSLNNTVSAKATINFETPSVSAGILSASPGLLTINAAAGQSATGTVSLSVPAGQQWSLSVAPAGLNTAWMKVAPQSGTGPAQITVSASGAGLANGAYIANLIFQSANTSPQFVTVGVAFVLGAAPANTMKIAAVANTASGQQVGAPGMYLSVYGTGLAPAGTSMASSSSPIPISLAGVSATVNGLPAAVEYVSPNQVNLLLPFEIPAGNTELAINNNGQVAAYTFSTQTAAPGIFVDGNGMVAGAESAARGAEIAFYVTGQGDVNPLIASNTAAAPPAAAPVPLQAVSVTIGGVAATVAYSALAYNFEGLMQVNVFVPSSIATGVQPIVVSVGGTPSLAAKINITN